MSRFLRGFHGRARADDDGRPNFPDSHPFWYAPTGWYDSFKDTGVNVTADVALTVSAIWAGVTFMGRNLGAMPRILYERSEVRGREAKNRAKDEPLFDILRWQPNVSQTAIEEMEMAVGHVILRGNYYARKVPGPRTGYCDNLVPMHPDRVAPERLPSGRVIYRVTGGKKPETLVQEEIHHVRGFGSDGVTGLSLAAVAARSIGGAVAADTYAARFLAHGASASVSVEPPPDMEDEEETALHDSISRYLNGLDNVGGVLIIPPGAKLDKLGISPADAQLLPTREHIVREMARWLGIPTTVLADAGKEPTHASAEVFGLQLVTQCFAPMAVRFEQAYQRDLILPEDKKRLFVELLMDSIARGDMKARAAYYQMAIFGGWMNRNEVRDKDNMNPGPEELDDFLQPMNIGVAGEARGTAGAAAGRIDEDEIAPTLTSRRVGGQVEARFGVRATMLAHAAAMSLLSREREACEKLAKKHANDGPGWAAGIRAFYEPHAVVVSQRLRIPMAVAREYCSKQGLTLERKGIACAEDWEYTVAPDLAALALGDHDVVAITPPKE